jgi:hypothetical protein
MIDLTSTAIENTGYRLIKPVNAPSHQIEKDVVNPVENHLFSPFSDGKSIDRVQISPEAQNLAEGFFGSEPEGRNLPETDQRKVAELKRTDHEVRTHEQAHMASGGSLVRGGAVYQYQTGPDGKRYAISGEVTLDASAIKDNPEATLQKARRIKQAALAPANPSSQDRAVASVADRMISEAVAEIQSKALEKMGLVEETPKTEKLPGEQKTDALPFWESEDWYFASKTGKKSSGFNSPRYLDILI